MSDTMDRVGWIDLSVDDHEPIRDFYQSVLGCHIGEVDMEEHHDYTLVEPGSGEAFAGVCRRTGAAGEMPTPAWMVYFTVPDLEQGLQAVRDGGGEVLGEIVDAGEYGLFAYVKDPAGAVFALWSKS